MNSLTRADIAKTLADKFDGVWDYAGIVDSVFDQLAAALANGQKVELRGFATFTVVHRGAKIGRNPKTGESVNIPPTKAIKFKAGKALKAAITTREIL